MASVTQNVIITVSSYNNNGVLPVHIKSLPEGSRELCNRFRLHNMRKHPLLDASKFYVDNAGTSYFKRFQLVDTYEELIDLINRNIFSICAYLVKVRMTNEKKLPV
jgi:hypothetical protein